MEMMRLETSTAPLSLWLLLTLLLLQGHSASAQKRILCPSNCSSLMDAGIVYDMKCQGLGDLDLVPPTCNDSRTIKVLTLEPEQTSIAKIQDRAFSGLRVVKLVLEKLNIRDLESNAFGGLQDLMILYLNDNLISQLPTGLFNGLSRLTILQLHSNRLSSLWSVPTSVGQSPSSSLLLLSSENDNQSNSALAPLVSLNTLTLQGNQISYISKPMFFSLGELESLNLERNQIQTLPSDVFANLTSLKTLNMASNEIVSLPDFLFVSSRNIESVDFSANRISDTSPNTFSNLTKLEKLYLNDNELTELRNDLFLGLVNLKTIRLDNNSITQVYSNSLTGMPLLTELHLQNNMIRVLPIGLFDPVGSLTLLNLSSNAVSRVEKMPFSSQGNLIQLDLSNNSLQEIPADWFPYTRSLQILRLDHNQIASINSTTFDQWSTLTDVNLGSNELPETQLRTLFLRSTNLQSLRLDENPLEHVTPETFGNLQSLARLYLNSSCIRNISFDWRPEALPLLQELYLQNNFIERISSGALVGLIQLQTLDVAFNYISVVEDSAFATNSLQLLNLTRNELNSSEAASIWSNALSQTTVDLSWNQIKDVEDFPSFHRIYLAGNPIVCSCSVFNDSAVDLSSFADFDVTTCSAVDSSMSHQSKSDSQLLICYISNQTVCNNRTTLALPNQLCQSEMKDYTETSSMNREIRVRELARCPSRSIVPPTEGNATLNRSQPVLLYISATVLGQTTMNVTWAVVDASDVQGFVVTWTDEKMASAGNVSRYIVLDASQTSLSVDGVQSSTSTNYTVCVQVMVKQLQQEKTDDDASLLIGDRKCITVEFDGERSTKKAEESSSLYPLILYIIIPVAVVVLIIVVVVIVFVVRQKKIANAKETSAADQPSNDQAISPTISKGTSMGLAEQSTVSVNIFNY